MSQHPDPHNRSSSTFPPADHPIWAELADRPRRPWLVFLAGMLLLIIIVGIVVGPLLYFALPGEAARWKIASAEEKRLNGDLPGAIADLDQALAQNPSNSELLRKRAQWLMEQKNYVAALEDCNRVIKLKPDDIESYQIRSLVYQFLDRHSEAVGDWKTINKLNRIRRQMDQAVALNGMAYARALADIEVDEGLADIAEALRQRGENAPMLDTRGYLYYRSGDYDRALSDLHRAVEKMEEELGAWRLETKKGRPGVKSRDQMDERVQQVKQAVAVIRYHRSLVHEALGNKDQAEADRQRVRELGFEPTDQLF